MRRNSRAWARSLSTEKLEADILHCRGLRDCFHISRRYDVYYAVIIGIYRAEINRRRNLPK